MAATLTPGAISKIQSGEWTDNQQATLRVSDIGPVPGNKPNKFFLQLTDGKSAANAIATTQVGKRITAGEISNGDVVDLTSYSFNKETAEARIFMIDVGTVHRGAVKEDEAAETVKEEAKENVAPAATPVPAVKKALPRHMLRTPGPAPSPSEEVGGAARFRSVEPPTKRRKSFQPIQSLNPYNNSWTIRARIANKQPLRTFEKSGTSKSVFSVELVDEQGTQIEATLWDEVADKYYPELEEGKVYYFSKGKVKPANRAYAAVRNDYTINLDAGSKIEESEDQDVSRMQAKMSFVAIDQLASHINSKRMADVVGVAISVGPLGSVKRKSDQAELTRREITLLDKSCKTVRLTLWGSYAEEQGAALEMEDAPVIAISACRVSDFDGVSIGSGRSSALKVNPMEVPEAAELRAWYDAVGRSAAHVPAGEGLASARGSGGGGARGRTTLAVLQKSEGSLPAPDAKPEYYNVVATITSIDPEQTPLYYDAAPDTGRKVVAQGDAWYCEHDGKTYDTRERRYIMRVKAADMTGECYLHLFNDQAVQLLGMKADELAQYKEGGGADGKEALEAIFKRAQFRECQLRVQTRTREYEGKLSQRCNVQTLANVNYAEESQRLIEMINKLTPNAATVA